MLNSQKQNVDEDKKKEISQFVKEQDNAKKKGL